jgi:hypothetical protein
MGYREIMADDDEQDTGELGGGLIAEQQVAEQQDNHDVIDAWEPEQQEQSPTPQQREEKPWQEMYLSLQGKYNAEIGRLNDENRRLRDELTERTSGPKVDPKAGYSQWMGGVMEGDAEGSFDQFAPIVSSLVEEQVQKAVEPYRHMAAQTAQAAFDAALTQRVPNWQQVNESPAFSAFLDSPDPLSGMTYRQLGESAMGRDVNRTALIFETFLNKAKRHGIPQQMVSPGRTTTATPRGSSGQITLAMLNDAEERFRKGKLAEDKYEAIQDQYAQQQYKT